MRSAKNLYPDWTIRIYHDETIDNSLICTMECATHENSELLMNNVDFCYVKNLPENLHEKFDASYMLPMTWRWLPIGDQFVDKFISRDSDSCISKRETAAVAEWLNSGTIFHIMRGT